MKALHSSIYKCGTIVVSQCEYVKENDVCHNIEGTDTIPKIPIVVREICTLNNGRQLTHCTFKN